MALGDVKHRKWYKAAFYKKGDTGIVPHTKPMASIVWVRRRAPGEMGEGGKAKPFQARICIGASRGGPRKFPRKISRCSSFEAGRGATPTKAIKAALADLAKHFE